MASMTPVVTASIAAAAVGSALLTHQPAKDKALAIKEHQTRVNEKEAAVVEKKRELRPKIAPEFDGVNCFETLVVH
ncbi:hypothetical protein EJ110_NYTH41772 [Nymphaea thermarum]|nr:hypothetical protein EJ110_NYTH41772 [Nymphaea thermarum]